MYFIEGRIWSKVAVNLSLRRGGKLWIRYGVLRVCGGRQAIRACLCTFHSTRYIPRHAWRPVRLLFRWLSRMSASIILDCCCCCCSPKRVCTTQHRFSRRRRSHFIIICMLDSAYISTVSPWSVKSCWPKLCIVSFVLLTFLCLIFGKRSYKWSICSTI